MRRSTIHFWVGVAGLIAFALTGQYMQWGLDRLQDMADGPRMAWRSAHIFLLLSSALNLVRGVYRSRFNAGSLAGKLESLASPLMIAAPFAYIASFFAESYVGAGERLLTFMGSVMVLAACVLLTGAAWFGREK